MDYDELVEDWIRYLKDNRIVSPGVSKTGKLDYQRSVDSSDVQHYLMNKGIDRNTIRQAISTVGTEPSSEAPNDQSQDAGNDQEDSQEDSTDNQSPDQEIKPGAEKEFPGVQGAKYVWLGKQWAKVNPKTGKPGQIAVKDVGNVLTKLSKGVDPSTSEILNARRRLNLFASKENNSNALIEDFTSNELSEKQIEQIFKIISTSAANNSDSPNNDNDSSEYSEKLNRIKNIIQHKMNDNQREALWRSLNG